MRSIVKSTGGRQAALLLVALLVLGITQLPAGVGTHGVQGQVATGSEVRYTVNGVTFIRTGITGQTAQALRDSLRIEIDADTRFAAVNGVDPEDPNGASIDVTVQGGGELAQMSVCETDATFNDVGVRFSAGKAAGLLNKPPASGSGTYRLRINVWDGADYDVTFNAADADKDTPAELLAAISSSLTAAGFNVADMGSSCQSFGSGISGSGCISISKSGNMLVSTRVNTTGAVLKEVCIGQEPTSSGIPTVSQYGMFALVLLLTISAIVMMRRRRTMAT